MGTSGQGSLHEAETGGEDPRRAPPVGKQLAFLHDAVGDLTSGASDLAAIKAQLSEVKGGAYIHTLASH